MRRAVILFDNNCGFCRWSLSKLLAWDRHARLRPVALQSEQADNFLIGMDRVVWARVSKTTRPR
jgi:predicted DCC family thiol-disulfide oxidoreductase YuxK